MDIGQFVLDSLQKLEQEQAMGTFTATYFLKTAFWDKRVLWTATLAVAFFARCWENADYHRAEMMKGDSRMFADRQKQLSPHSDFWKY